MTEILLSILLAVVTSPPQSFCQDYINFYDDVHPRPRWQDMPQSVEVSAADFAPDFWDKFFHTLQNKTPSREENIARSLGESLGESLGDSSYDWSEYSFFPGKLNARDRFLFGGGSERKKDPQRQNYDLYHEISASVFDGNAHRDAANRAKAGGLGFVRVNNFGDLHCNPENPKTCYDFAYVKCIPSKDAYGSTVYKCGCDFQHTEVPFQRGKPRCLKNVFTQCTMGNQKYKCGENMDCVPDTLHLEEESFCRCKEGFAPAKNSLGIPAFCRPIIKEDSNKDEEEQEDFGAKEAHAALILIRHSLLLLSLMAIAAMA